MKNKYSWTKKEWKRANNKYLLIIIKISFFFIAVITGAAAAAWVCHTTNIRRPGRINVYLSLPFESINGQRSAYTQLVAVRAHGIETQTHTQIRSINWIATNLFMFFIHSYFSSIRFRCGTTTNRINNATCARSHSSMAMTMCDKWLIHISTYNWCECGQRHWTLKINLICVSLVSPSFHCHRRRIKLRNDQIALRSRKLIE